MANQAPFINSKIECPICKTINEFETIKVGAYTEEGRDTDFCPTNIRWRNPRYQAYSPLLFFTATCSNCFYTRELNSKYKEWKNDNYFRSYRLKPTKERHLEELSSSESIIKIIGARLNNNRFPNETAILKLHLAIFDEMLGEHPSDLDLGRFFLRIGWIYRTMANVEDPNKAFLYGMMHELDERFGSIRGAINSAGAEIEAFSNHLGTHFKTDNLAAEIKAQMLTFRDQYENEVGTLRDQVTQVQNRLSNLNDLINEYKTAIAGGGDVNQDMNFGPEGGFREFMLKLKSRWPDVVTTELEALEKAVLYYKKAFANGKDISQGNQQIQASYLIAELSRRIGDFDEAKQYFTSTIKAGQEFIYQNRNDRSRTVLARKIMELAIEQGRANLKASKPA